MPSRMKGPVLARTAKSKSASPASAAAVANAVPNRERPAQPTRFTASKEANASEGNKQCIIDSSGEEIVYTNLFTGVHGNYLKRSVAAAGLDPDALPEADKSKMNFASGGNSKAKAWRDIWGAGQGVGHIFDAPPAAEIVARLKAEYEAARAALFAGETVPTRFMQAAE